MHALIHGGDIYRHPGVLDFSSNMNPLGTPESVTAAAAFSLKDIAHYPDVRHETLMHLLAEYEETDPANLILGNGAAELISLWALAVKPAHALLPAPTFSEYERALLAAGAKIRFHALKEEDRFALRADILDEITEDLDALVLCNPNNPTGVLIEPDLLQRIIDRCRKTRTSLLVDECFLDFCDAGRSLSAKKMLQPGDDVFLLRAFTKRYAMAGLRLGYGFSENPALLARMESFAQPWNVSIPAEAAGAAALREEAYVVRARKIVSEERRFLKEELTARGFSVIDGRANYILFRGPAGLVEHALEKNVLIRDCSNYRGLCPGWYRIAVRTHAENLRLLDALS